MATIDAFKAFATTVAPLMKSPLTAGDLHAILPTINKTFTQAFNENDNVQVTWRAWYHSNLKKPGMSATQQECVDFFRARFPYLPPPEDGSGGAFNIWYGIAFQLMYNSWNFHQILVGLDGKGAMSSDNPLEFRPLTDDWEHLKNNQAPALAALFHNADPVIRQRLVLPSVKRTAEQEERYFRTHKTKEVRVLESDHDDNRGFLGGILIDHAKNPALIQGEIGGEKFRLKPVDHHLDEFKLQRLGGHHQFTTTFPTKVIQYLIRKHGSRLITLALE